MRNTYKREGEATRQRLLDAGLSAFSKKGYSATRLEDIARGAGLTRGVIYWHFRYKLELFLGIFSDKLDELSAETQTFFQSERAPYETLRNFILHVPTKLIEDDSFYAFGRLRYKIEWTDGLEEAVMEPFLEKQAKERHSALVRLIEAEKSSGAFRLELATPVIANMIDAFSLGLVHQILDGRDSIVPVEDIQLLVDSLYNPAAGSGSFC